jgi:hypothetical protein
VGAFAAHGPESESAPAPASGDGSGDVGKTDKDFEAAHSASSSDQNKEGSFMSDEDSMAQLVGVAILEFGVVLHRHVEFIIACICSC